MATISRSFSDPFDRLLLDPPRDQVWWLMRIGVGIFGGAGVVFALTVALFLRDRADQARAHTRVPVRTAIATVSTAQDAAPPSPLPQKTLSPAGESGRQPSVALPLDDRSASPRAVPIDPPVVPLPPLSRIVIPSIGVDRQVVAAATIVIDDAYGPVQTWEVPKYAVGHHSDSAQPGGGSNIVLSGHVGGTDPVFPRLIDLAVGDAITLYRGDVAFHYTVSSSRRLQEVGVSVSEQWANATVLDPTEHEVLTIITCWPPAGPNAFDQRLVVQALPTAERNQ